MIDLTINEKQLPLSLKRARERGITIPTFEEMIHPESIQESTKGQLKSVNLWEVNPLNLFRITWKNEPKAEGGQFGGVNFLEIPSELTGVKARIFALVGKWFPTGAHKVGASFACLQTCSTVNRCSRICFTAFISKSVKNMRYCTIAVSIPRRRNSRISSIGLLYNT